MMADVKYRVVLSLSIVREVHLTLDVNQLMIDGVIDWTPESTMAYFEKIAKEKFFEFSDLSPIDFDRITIIEIQALD